MMLRPWTAKLTDPGNGAHASSTNRAVAHALGVGLQDGTAATIAEYIRHGGAEPEAREYRVDRLQIEILGSHGIDLRRLMHAKHLGLGFGVDILHGDRWTERTVMTDEDAPCLTGQTTIAPGVRLDTRDPARPSVSIAHSVHGEHPQMALGALAGRRLSAVLGAEFEADPLITGIGDIAGHLVLHLEGCDFVDL